MSSQSTRVFTENILELQASLEKGKKEFRETFEKNSLSLHNTSCGDSYLGSALQKICYQAIEKFILA